MDDFQDSERRNRIYEIPGQMLVRWQQTIDLMAQVCEVPAGLVMRVHPEQIEVLVASQTEGNPYEPGEMAQLQTGLYCETVMAERAMLAVPNALEDSDWRENPDVALGMICYLGVPITWPGGEVFGTVCVLDTETRHFSDTYKALIWQLKDIFEGDLRFLTELQKRAHVEEQLREAKELAEQANHAKSQFLANMSHELRTPLNAILGFAQLMHHSGTLNEEQRENLGILRRSGEHLLSLINSVLDLSKIEAGRMMLHETVFDFYELLDDLEDMFRLQAHARGLTLSVSYEANVPRLIRSDRVKVRQVLINLLSNAFKFTNEGMVSVRVRRGVCPTPPATTPIVVEVEDTGSGIAAHEISNLFEAFTQTSNGRQSQEGTGLGLVISREFARLMGGDIQVRSQEGCGSIFSFTLVVGTSHHAPSRLRESTQTVIGLLPGQPTYRILVADDCWTNRQLLMRMLTPLGFEVREASNGIEAVALWESWHPQLIWMDMRMPVMDGYESTRRIKTTTRGQATAIVALTASTLEEERGVVLSVGCDDFIRKPFCESDIFEAMHKHIGVRYQYGDTLTIGESEPLSPELLRTVSLAVLPAEVLDGLEQALLRTSPDAIRVLTGHVRSHDPTVAMILDRLTDDFDYPTMLQLIHRARAHDEG